MFRTLDALGNDVDPEGLTERDDSRRDRAVVQVVWHALHEAAVDLEGVDRKEPQRTEGGVAGAEVVDGDPDTARLQRTQVVDGPTVWSWRLRKALRCGIAVARWTTCVR